jgi:signal transduction histidine kinase
LVRALNDVTAAVSGSRSLRDVLDALIDAAKAFTGTEKAVLILVDEDYDRVQLDTSSAVVRGSRYEHDESWWGPWLPEIADTAFADEKYFYRQAEEADAWVLGVPVMIAGRPLGLFVIINSRSHRLGDEQVAFMSILSATAASAIENARLAQDSRYALLASERERISREMHDGIAQSLFGVSLGLEVCRKMAWRDPAAATAKLEELEEALSGSMAELRRYIYDLRPIPLRELGLEGALDCWVNDITVGDGMRAQFVVSGAKRKLSPDHEACIYRVAREATTNAAKHAEARTLQVVLSYEENHVRLLVQDDGQGFDPEEASGGSEGTVGLGSMRDRVRRVGGTLSLNSESGRGTRLDVVIPC